MDVEDKVIWQQAAGDSDRNYVRECLGWDVIVNGPGAEGPWPECRTKLEARGVSSRKITDLARFAEEMKPGDLVVLRTGTKLVRGVGEIDGPYQWHDEFGDIDGWDLQHVRRVRWYWKGGEEPARFAAYSLKLGDTTQLLNEGEVLEWLVELDTDQEGIENRPLRELPEEADRTITVDEISEFLFDHGVASTAINSLIAQIGELTRIARWYRRAGRPSEHETVAYLVAPLLRSLGWTPQRMAVEWNRLDLALFSTVPRDEDGVVVVVEAKKMGNSCLTALSQAEAYAKSRPHCRRLIVTDGTRYGVYTKDGDQFELHSYLNLTRLRADYPIYGCGGAEEAMFAMSPYWGSDKES